MSSIAKRTKDIYNAIIYGASKTFGFYNLEPGQVENGLPDEIFRDGENYFRVVVNEIFLANSRVLWSDYDPVVYSVVEFVYDKTMREEPMLIGPATLEKYRKPVPQGVRYINTPVSGLHPYQGGDFTITIILYKVRRTDYLTKLLKTLEKVSGVFNPSIAMASYLNIAEVLVDGLEMLAGMQQTQPIVAVRETLNLGVSDGFKPGFFVLINAPEKDLKNKKFWVRDGRLCEGKTMDVAQPYADHDFVLYNIQKSDRRDDIKQLSFYPAWEETLRLAASPGLWEEAKANYTALYLSLLSSPDLIDSQKDSQAASFQDAMQWQRQEAKRRQTMGAEAALRGLEPEPVQRHLARTLKDFLSSLD